MGDKMGNKYNLAKDTLGVWLNGYLQGEMNASSFTILMLLSRVKEKEISDFFTGTIAFIYSYVSKKHLTPKEEQQITNIIKKIMLTQNDTENDETEKAKRIEDCDESIKEILAMVER